MIASKFPQKGQKKKEAMEVRDDIFLSPPACDPIETAVVLNKYDVLVSLKPGMDIVCLAGIWDTVGKIAMQSVMHRQINLRHLQHFVLHNSNLLNRSLTHHRNS